MLLEALVLLLLVRLVVLVVLVVLIVLVVTGSASSTRSSLARLGAQTILFLSFSRTLQILVFFRIRLELHF